MSIRVSAESQIASGYGSMAQDVTSRRANLGNVAERVGQQSADANDKAIGAASSQVVMDAKDKGQLEKQRMEREAQAIKQNMLSISQQSGAESLVGVQPTGSVSNPLSPMMMAYMGK